MAGAISRVEFVTAPNKPLRVAAYARVSRDCQALTHSFSAQVSYYNELIGSHPGWELAGIYTDYAVTGTSTKARTGFNDMMAAARAGGIDVILTKSISRFARNTVDLLKAVRELKTLQVAVRFERERIDTSTTDGEVLLTLLASFAQAEAETISESVKWGIRKKYADGIAHSRQPYGYTYQEGKLLVNDDEAAVVRLLFANYLEGISPEATATKLNQAGIKPRRGTKFRGNMLRRLLENPLYTGQVILQQVYRPHIANSAVTPNTGELDQYIVDDHHEAIIDPQVYAAVQAELAYRRQAGLARSPGERTCGLTSKITCTQCGRHYHRRTKTRKNGNRYWIWWCYNATTGNGNPCHAPQIADSTLRAICQHALAINVWDDEAIITRIENINISPTKQIKIALTGGQTRCYNYETWRG